MTYLNISYIFHPRPMSSHLSFSYPSGPPTPSITPKSATFKDPFGTPRHESSFYDPRFSPGDPYVAGLEFLKTPKAAAATTPTKSPTLTRGIKRPFPGHDIETEIATHVHHLSPNSNLPLPPVEPSRQLSSSPNSLQNRRSTQEEAAQEAGNKEELGSSMRSASSMQTPPPTSTSATKRKARQAQVAKLVKESAANGGRKAAPIFPEPSNATPTSPVEASPQQFSTIQFSPEVFGSFAMAGPATAPAYPQQKLFWDPQQEANAMNIDFGTSDTFAESFGLDNSKHVESFASNNDNMALSHMTTSSFDIDNAMGISMPSSAAQDINYLSSAGLITNGSVAKLSNTVVDPSLLFSSPNQAPEHTSMNISQRTNRDEDMRPYAHQIREAERERESSETRKPKRRRGPQSDSPAVKAALQALRGEEEDCGPQVKSSKDAAPAKLFRGRRSSSRLTFEDVAHGSSNHTRRRSSHRSSSGRRRSKQTVTLTIGPDGRAKTETKIVAEPVSGSAMDAESDSGDTESLSSNSEVHMASSRVLSFAGPLGNTQNKKLGRSGSNFNTHSKKSSYASTQPDLIDPALTTTFIHEPLGGSGDQDSDASIAVASGDEKGDAQSELKKMRARSRANGQFHGSASTSTSANRYVFGSNTHPSQHALTPSQDVFHNISPTTITDPDLATPSTGRDSTISSNTTRCVCHNLDSDGELMILW
ncbi:MAG: hypothetical protein Q9191_001419 [Dirinaria sp. TL-2023a]